MSGALALLAVLFSIGAANAQAAPRVLVSSFGAFTTAEALAVDPGLEAVYVLDRGDGTVDRFDLAGDPLPFSASETYASGNQLTGTPEGAFSLPGGESEAEIAVAPPGAAAGTAGNLYVTNGNGTAIDVFDATGAHLGRITEAGGSSFGFLCGVAVDPSGAVYASDFSAGAIHRFLPTANPSSNDDFDSSITGVATPCNVAAGSANVYASTWLSGPLVAYPISLFPGEGKSFDASTSGTTVEDGGAAVTANAAYVDPLDDDLYVDEGQAIAVFDSAGALLERVGGGGDLAGSRGVAVDGSSGAVFAADSAGAEVAIFDEPTPGPPTVLSVAVSGVSATEAILRARINPNSVDTSYHFEYVDGAGFQSSGFDDAPRVPVPDAGLGAGFTPITVSKNVAGLTPGTTYHFRVVATNALGPTEGPPREFETFAQPTSETCPNAEFRGGLSADLPNCRAYELVTPAIKDYGFGGLPGQIILPAAVGAVGGDDVVFNAGGPLPGATAGPFIGHYLASRDGSGWQSTSISAPQAPIAGLGGAHPAFLAFSPELTKALTISANPPLTPDAPPDTVSLYLQDVGASSWTLLTPAGGGPGNLGDFVRYAGASTDFSHLYYDSFTPQTPEAPAEAPDVRQVYGFSDGRVYLAGILPDGTVAGEATAASGATSSVTDANPRDVVSRDGSRVFFTHSLSSIPNRQLYLRLNADQPQSALDGEGSCTESALACTIRVSASLKTNGEGPGGTDPHEPDGVVKEGFLTGGVQFEAADPNASKVLFSSPLELTNDANTGRNGGGESTDLGNDLYEYDVETGVLRDLTVATDPADKETGANVLGVLGAAEDLSYVYFVATGNLAAGAQSGAPNLYVAHEGEISLIATLDAATDGANWGRDSGRSSRVTPDGKSVVFTSTASPTGYDNTGAESGEPVSEVFLYSATEGELLCASCNPSGANPIGGSRIPSRGLSSSGSFNPTHSLSDNGSRVFFESEDALVPRDINGRTDVYMYEGGRISLISAGIGDTNATFGDATPSGGDVWFATRERLLPQDRDGLPDLYDARVLGGFPPPTAADAGCGDESCRPPAAPPPPPLATGTATFAGPGNRKPRRPHKKKHRKRKHNKHRRHAGQQRSGAVSGGGR